MRQAGKLNIKKFIMYLILGGMAGAVLLGAISYFIVIPRGGNASIAIGIGSVFGAIFGGPLLASNLAKEK